MTEGMAWHPNDLVKPGVHRRILAQRYFGASFPRLCFSDPLGFLAFSPFRNLLNAASPALIAYRSRETLLTSV